MSREEREKLYHQISCEALELLDEIKSRVITIDYLDCDLERKINLMNFLSIKLRQILRYAEGGD